MCSLLYFNYISIKLIKLIRECGYAVLLIQQIVVAYFDTGNKDLIVETGSKLYGYEYPNYGIFRNNFIKNAVELKENRFLI